MGTSLSQRQELRLTLALSGSFLKSSPSWQMDTAWSRRMRYSSIRLFCHGDTTVTLRRRRVASDLIQGFHGRGRRWPRLLYGTMRCMRISAVANIMAMMCLMCRIIESVLRAASGLWTIYESRVDTHMQVHSICRETMQMSTINSPHIRFSI